MQLGIRPGCADHRTIQTSTSEVLDTLGVPAGRVPSVAELFDLIRNTTP